jgi:flagellar protein FlaG
MRILGNGATENIKSNINTQTKSIELDVKKQGYEEATKLVHKTVETNQPLENVVETKAKVKEAVKKMNEMLEINNNAAKFVYHEGLERYYVTVVNSQTEEVVKEIPPKKLLDAFYEMQKMLGMIVDEKI